MTFSIQKKEKYSRLNFWMRVLLVYYLLFAVHFVLILGYSYAAYVASWLNMLMGFLTGRRHFELTDFTIRNIKWQTKTGLSLLGFIEEVPNIDILKEANDATFSIDIDVPEKVSRSYTILRLFPPLIMIFLLPQFLYLLILAIVMEILYIIGFIVILFTGNWIDLTFNFMKSFYPYVLRVNFYMMGLSDEYPGFSLGNSGN